MEEVSKCLVDNHKLIDPNYTKGKGELHYLSEDFADYFSAEFGVGENLSSGNIVLWAKDALAKGDLLNIVDDQFRAPTLAEDLADICILAAKKKAFGIFNASGKDIMSIYEMVERIGKYYGLDTTNLNKISTSTLNQKAKRPPRTGFVLDKSSSVLEYNPHSFEDALGVIKEQL